MEEGSNRLLGSSPLLNIIDNQHINRLIEVDEVVDGILATGIGKLYLEQASRYIEYALARIHLLTTNTNSIDQVGLTTSRRTINKEWIEGRLARMLSNRETYRARQLVRVALDIALESLMRIQLWIQILGYSTIKRRRSLVGGGNTASGINLNRLTTLFVDSNLILLVNNDTIVKLYVSTKATLEYLIHQSHIVLLQILIHIPTRHLYEESSAVFVIMLENNGREPCLILLLCDDVLNQVKAVVPKRLWIIYHAAFTYLLY